MQAVAVAPHRELCVNHAFGWKKKRRAVSAPRGCNMISKICNLQSTLAFSVIARAPDARSSTFRLPCRPFRRGLHSTARASDAVREVGFGNGKHQGNGMVISELLDAAKRAQGSLGTVADRLGIDQSHLSHWRKGRSNPTATQIARLAEMASLPVLETVAQVEAQLEGDDHHVWARALAKLRAAGLAGEST
jgi:hypothetical protein